MFRASADAATPLAPHDVPESRFGVWFQSTRLWRQYVLLETLDVLERLARPRARFARVLDAGCGCGLAFRLLRERFGASSVTGVDADAALIARARREHAAEGEARLGDVRKLELPDSAFDLVLCHQTLHHVSAPAAALSEFRRVLAPGGVLLLAESCAPFLRMAWVRLLFRHPRGASRSAADYVALVRDAGFALSESAVATPAPRWAEPLFGLARRRSRDITRAPLVCLAATRPA
ncbi:MAG TPA: class I SAM-dependent methyltransferase [Myxococcota bacterium]|nr:class I SAM-dependent methyltransferase [Myxococcota bacterium]